MTPRDDTSLYLLPRRYRQFFWDRRCPERDKRITILVAGLFRRNPRCLLREYHPDRCVFFRNALAAEQRGETGSRVFPFIEVDGEFVRNPEWTGRTGHDQADS